MWNAGWLLAVCIMLASCASGWSQRSSWEGPVEKSETRLKEMETQLAETNKMYDREFERVVEGLMAEAVAFKNLQNEKLARNEITKAEYDYNIVQKQNELKTTLAAQADQISTKRRRAYEAVEKAYANHQQLLESISRDLAEQRQRLYAPPSSTVQPQRSFNCTSNAIGSTVFTNCN